MYIDIYIDAPFCVYLRTIVQLKNAIVENYGHQLEDTGLWHEWHMYNHVIDNHVSSMFNSTRRQLVVCNWMKIVARGYWKPWPWVAVMISLRWCIHVIIITDFHLWINLFCYALVFILQCTRLSHLDKPLMKL